jgi:hypothetical protein
MGFAYAQPILRLITAVTSSAVLAKTSGASRHENAGAYLNQSAVIASEAQQSISRRKGRMDCFVAEPVIGRAFARPIGSSQ